MFKIILAIVNENCVDFKSAYEVGSHSWPRASMNGDFVLNLSKLDKLMDLQAHSVNISTSFAIFITIA